MNEKQAFCNIKYYFVDILQNAIKPLNLTFPRNLHAQCINSERTNKVNS